MELKIEEKNGEDFGYGYNKNSTLKLELTASKSIVIAIRKAIMEVIAEKGE